MLPDDYLRAIETELACIPMDSAYRVILLDLIDQYGESMYCIGHEDGYTEQYGCWKEVE